MIVLVHPDRYKKKPNSDECAHINSTICCSNNVKDVTPKELAQLLVAGHSIIPAYLEGSGNARGEMWRKQRVFMIDFDNKPPHDVVSIEDVLDLCRRAEIWPAFVYETFSSSIVYPRFRLAFVLDRDITTNLERRKILNAFLNALYVPVLDTTCINAARFFFGGTKLLLESYNSTVSVEFILKPNRLKVASYQGLKPAGKFDIDKKKNTLCMLGLTSPLGPNSINSLRGKLGIKTYKLVSSTGEMIDYLTKEVDLGKYLDVSGNSFCCLFHDDTVSSAGLFTDDKGVMVYNCFGCGMHGDIIDVVQGQRQCTFELALRFLQELFMISIKTDWYVLLHENIELIRSEELTKMIPEAWTVIKRCSKEILALNEIALEHLHENITCREGLNIFFVSNNFLAYRLKKDQKAINVSLNLMAFHGFCKKIPDADIPEKFLNRAIEISKEKQHKDTICFYSIPHYGNCSVMGLIKERSKEFKDNSGSIQGFSQEWVYRTFGENLANEVYPKRQGKVPSEDSDKFQAKLEKHLMKSIEKKGYALESALKKKLSGDEIKFKRVLQETLNKYQLKRRKVNKVEKNSYGIKSKGYPNIIVAENKNSIKIKTS